MADSNIDPKALQQLKQSIDTLTSTITKLGTERIDAVTGKNPKVEVLPEGPLREFLREEKGFDIRQNAEIEKLRKKLAEAVESGTDESRGELKVQIDNLIKKSRRSPIQKAYVRMFGLQAIYDKLDAINRTLGGGSVTTGSKRLEELEAKLEETSDPTERGVVHDEVEKLKAEIETSRKADSGKWDASAEAGNIVKTESIGDLPKDEFFAELEGVTLGQVHLTDELQNKRDKKKKAKEELADYRRTKGKTTSAGFRDLIQMTRDEMDKRKPTKVAGTKGLKDIKGIIPWLGRLLPAIGVALTAMGIAGWAGLLLSVISGGMLIGVIKNIWQALWEWIGPEVNDAFGDSDVYLKIRNGFRLITDGIETIEIFGKALFNTVWHWAMKFMKIIGGHSAGIDVLERSRDVQIAEGDLRRRQADLRDAQQAGDDEKIKLYKKQIKTLETVTIPDLRKVRDDAREAMKALERQKIDDRLEQNEISNEITKLKTELKAAKDENDQQVLKSQIKTKEEELKRAKEDIQNTYSTLNRNDFAGKLATTFVDTVEDEFRSRHWFAKWMMKSSKTRNAEIDSNEILNQLEGANLTEDQKRRLSDIKTGNRFTKGINFGLNRWIGREENWQIQRNSLLKELLEEYLEENKTEGDRKKPTSLTPSTKDQTSGMTGGPETILGELFAETQATAAGAIINGINGGSSSNFVNLLGGIEFALKQTSPIGAIENLQTAIGALTKVIARQKTNVTGTTDYVGGNSGDSTVGVN